MALQPSLSSSSSSSSLAYTYDVFLSFRGTDTRYGFTGNLYKDLCDKGINTFIDDEELQRGEEITPSLVKAIQESRVAIPVFSTNYAASSFCLDELVEIMECFKANGRLILPVFYNMDPSDVRHQKGSYEEAMTKHEERFNDDMEKVKKWREALSQAANLSGYHFKHGDGYEHKFIGNIVQAVSRKIKHVVLPIADYLVGLESQVSKVTCLLNVGSNDGVHMVGIYGIGGLGKTTLAVAVYNSIADNFEGTCFLENVRENSNKYGLEHLQSTLLSELLGEKKIKLVGVQQGTSIIQHRLQKKKVLLILDDVDKQEQLQAIIGKLDWFGPGSRVIITTRDKQLLACHGVERTYEVEELDNIEALKLLSWKAFKNINVNPIFMDMLKRAVTYACGLPLALEVIGSNLFGKNVEQWKSALDRYKKIPDIRIHNILVVSFNALGEDEQSVFLDIACCFKGYQLPEVEDILHAHHGGSMKYHIDVLVDKSLVKISRDGKVMLHDLIEDMGKEIVRQKSPKEPGKRSRLWFHEDIIQVIEDNQGTAEIEIIHLDFSSLEVEKEVEWDGNAFGKMKNLKTLIIKDGHFSEGPKHLPNSLRVLEWWTYPSQSLPYNFHPKNLSILKLPGCCHISLDLALSSKKFVKLKVLDFECNKYLTEIPDMSGLPNLEKLSFQSCQNLTTIHNSVGFLDKLKFLCAYYCRKLRSFPPIKLPSLETLELSGCSSLENFPEILGKIENITQLHLEGTCIKELPFSFRNLSRLQRFTLSDIVKRKIPSNIVMMPELTEIIASHWDGSLTSKVDEGNEIVNSMVSSSVECLRLRYWNLSDDFFPKGLAWFANVKELELTGSYNFTIIPACIKEFRFLWKLDVDDCRRLREIRGIPPNLKYFTARNCQSLISSCRSMLLNQELHEAGNTEFTLPGSRVPEWFEHRSRGGSISFWFRNKFPAIALCLAFRRNEDYCGFGPIVMIINGNKRYTYDPDRDYIHPNLKGGHIHLFDIMKFEEGNLDEALFEKEWNHLEISLELKVYEFAFISANVLPGMSSEKFGIHVFKQKSIMEDIRFTDPYKRRKLDDGLSSPESQKSMDSRAWREFLKLMCSGSSNV